MLSQRIAEISPDARVRRLLESLDQNRDARIDSDEVDFDRDGFLDSSSTSFSWSIEQRNSIQNALFQRGFIRFRTIERLELAGNPNFGTVVFLRQNHDRPELNDRIRVPIGRFQAAILLYLMAHNAEHVFDEGLTRDVLGFVPSNPIPPHEGLERARNQFMQRLLAGNIADSSFALQAQDGASSIYALLFNDIQLHRTAEPWEEAYYRRIIDNHDLPAALRNHYRMRVREKAAASQVLAFLRAHPGEVAYLVYGARHEFADNFWDPFFNPRLISVTFPDHSELVDRVVNEYIDQETKWLNRASAAFLSLAVLLGVGKSIARFIFPPNPPDDPGSPPASQEGGSTHLSPTQNDGADQRTIHAEEVLGISALLAAGAAAVHYAPQAINTLRTVAPIAVRATLLGLMMLGG